MTRRLSKALAENKLHRELHNLTIINIRGESFRLKEKRQAARSAVNGLLEVSAPSQATTTEETTMT